MNDEMKEIAKDIEKLEKEVEKLKLLYNGKIFENDRERERFNICIANFENRIRCLRERIYKA